MVKMWQATNKKNQRQALSTLTRKASLSILVPSKCPDAYYVTTRNTFCTSPFTRKSPSIGTILQTAFPAAKASPYVPSPTLMILSRSLCSREFQFASIRNVVNIHVRLCFKAKHSGDSQQNKINDSWTKILMAFIYWINQKSGLITKMRA